MTRLFFTCVVLLVFPLSAAVAQSNAQKPLVFGTTKVAAINVGLVFNKYERAQAIKKELEEAIQPFKEKGRALVDEVKKARDSLDLPGIDAETSDRLDDLITRNKRQLEDLQTQIKKLIGDKQKENMMKLWKDIHEATKVCARLHGVKLVLSYGDPVDLKELHAFDNVSRKMNAMDQGALIPSFVEPEADLSEIVIEYLNNQYRAKKKAPPLKIDLE